MKPVIFPEVNALYGAGQPQYEPLPAAQTEDGQVITCWELSDEEKARVAETGQIWLCQLTFNNPLQPVFMTTDKADLVRPVEEPAQQEDASDGDSA